MARYRVGSSVKSSRTATGPNRAIKPKRRFTTTYARRVARAPANYVPHTSRVACSRTATASARPPFHAASAR